MKSNKKLMQIRYHKEEDSYELYLSTDGGETWGYSLGCKCQLGIHDRPEDEPMLISCAMLEEIKKAVLCGFELVY